MRKCLIVDGDTGEMLREVVLGETTSVHFKEQRSGKVNRYGDYDIKWTFDNSQQFVRAWDVVMPSLIDNKLTGAEWDVILYLAGHTDYDSGVAMQPNREHVTINDIIRDCQLSEKTVIDSLIGLENKEVIGRFIVGEDKRKFSYFVNPFVFVKGVKINSTLVEMFKNTKYYRPGWIRQDKDDFLIGYKNKEASFAKIWINILPEIISARLSKSEMITLFYCASNLQYQTGIIAYSNGRKCGAKNISEDCNLPIRRVNDSLSTLEKYGIISFGFEKDNSDVFQEVIYFNPFIISKGNNCLLSLAKKFKDTPYAKKFIADYGVEENRDRTAQKVLKVLMQ